MFFSERLLNQMSYKDIYLTLKMFIEEDCYLVDILTDDLSSDFIYLLEVYDLVFLSSDDRILLTQKGEKLLHQLILPVELSKKRTKLIKKHL